MEHVTETSRQLVYVASNDFDGAGNTVLAYRRAADGTLTESGRYPTGGRGFANPDGVVGPEDADQSMVINADGTLLFVVNGGSDDISVFTIAADGSLSLVSGAPFPSGGTQPVSLGLAGRRLYVVNKDQDPGRPATAGLPNYTVFEVAASGRLSAVPEATVTTTKGASPAQALISGDGRFLFGAEPFGGTVRSFRIDGDGRLEPRSSVDVGAAHPSPVGLAAHPGGQVLYVGLPTRAELAVFTYDDAGELRLARTAPNSQRALCWIVTSADGSRVYTVNNASNSVSVYDTRDPQSPAETQSVRLDSTGGAFQEALSGGFLHVITVNGTGARPDDNALHVLPVGPDGALGAPRKTVLPVPAAAHPFGVACL
jgi:6-phosphogluconolactonase (cycloisomerase 2 family)